MSTTQKTQPRRLTVTYYVEPQNLRTITIPVHRANVLILGLSGAVLWTLGSGVFLGAQLFGSGTSAPAVAALNEAVTPPVASVAPVAPQPVIAQKPVAKAKSKAQADDAALAAVAAKAAKAKAADDALAAAQTRSATVETPVKAAEPVVAAAEVAPAEAPAAVFGPPAVLADPTASLPLAAGANEPLSARIQVKDPEFAYKADEGVFNLDFKIQNKGKPEAKGKVWGVATFTTRTGKHLEIASADGVNFRAKALTLKALQFPLPQSEPGYIAEVTIHVSEDAGKDEMTSTYKLDESGKTGAP